MGRKMSKPKVIFCVGYFNSTKYSDRPYKPDFFAVTLDNKVKSRPIYDHKLAELKEKVDKYCVPNGIDPLNLDEITADPKARSLNLPYVVELEKLMNEHLLSMECLNGISEYIKWRDSMDGKASVTQDYFMPFDATSADMEPSTLQLAVPTRKNATGPAPRQASLETVQPSYHNPIHAPKKKSRFSRLFKLSLT